MNLYENKAVLLCGGKSSRMQRDKCFLQINEQSLVKYQFDKLSKLFKEVYISTKEDKFKKEFKNLILDEAKFYSPLLALKSVLSFLKDENAHVFICAIDTVNISKYEISRLFENLENSKAIVAKSNYKTHALCGFYHTSLLSLCEDFLQKNKHKMQDFLKACEAKELEFKDDKAFLNLNFYEQYLEFINEN